MTLRGLKWLALSDTGQILAGTITDDSGGGASTVWVAGSALPCRIDPLGADTNDLVGDRVSERSTHRVTFPAETAVSVSNRVAIQGRGTFEITAVPDRTAEWSRVIEVIPL